MKTGVLLINTGTPDAPTLDAVRAYLHDFLSDPAIIGAPEFIRKRIVNHACKHRPLRTVEHYKGFWTDAGSPFMLTSIKQCERLGIELKARVVEPTQVVLSMRYGNPSIAAGLQQLRESGCEHVILLPLYPQNVNVCAGTCLKEAHECLERLAQEGWKPQVSEVKSFHSNEHYRHALASSVRKAWEYVPGSKLLVSFHSTMLADIKKDDTYLVQCTQTKDWLVEELGLDPADAILCFQSRFDSRKWLSPFTEQTLIKLQKQGVNNVCIICPGFVADNIETMIEVNADLRGKFCAPKIPGHAGQTDDRAVVNAMQKMDFTYVPALNTSAGLIHALADEVCKLL